jgi:hypothetical protein
LIQLDLRGNTSMVLLTLIPRHSHLLVIGSFHTTPLMSGVPRTLTGYWVSTLARLSCHTTDAIKSTSRRRAAPVLPTPSPGYPDRKSSLPLTRTSTYPNLPLFSQLHPHPYPLRPLAWPPIPRLPVQQTLPRPVHPIPTQLSLRQRVPTPPLAPYLYQSQRVSLPTALRMNNLSPLLPPAAPPGTIGVGPRPGSSPLLCPPPSLRNCLWRPAVPMPHYGGDPIPQLGRLLSPKS